MGGSHENQREINGAKEVMGGEGGGRAGEGFWPHFVLVYIHQYVATNPIITNNSHVPTRNVGENKDLFMIKMLLVV